jgi:hypothetical protein
MNSVLRRSHAALVTLLCAGATLGSARAQERPKFVVNDQLAAKGALVWRSRSCAGCHTLGHGRLTAPDLKGVMSRRTPTWIKNWLKNPGRMARTDETAKRLVNEAGTIMTDFHLSDAEINQLQHFFARVNETP